MKLRDFLIPLIVLFICFINNAAASATTLHGVGLDARDGQTINVKIDNRTVTVSLCAVRAPRSGQSLADIARSHLEILTKGKQISIEYNGLAQDGMLVGIVTADGVDVGMQMIRDGAALYDRKYQDDVPPEYRSLYEKSESAARAEARGLWKNQTDVSIKALETETKISTSPTESERREAKKLSDEAHEMIVEGNSQAAMARAREAIRLDPNLGEAHKNLALLFFNTRHYEDALPEAREALRLSPDSDKAHLVMSKVLYGLGDFEGSVKECRRAIAINPRYGRAYYDLGVSYRELRQFEHALSAFRQAEGLLTDTTDLADNQLNIGVVLSAMGRHAEARERWRRVLTMGDANAALLAELNLQQR